MDEPQRVTRARWLRFVVYVFFTAAGVLLTIYPLRAALEVIAEAYTYIGAGLMLLGGALSAIGAAWDRWSGEALGLPMCFTSFVLFGGVLCWRGSLAGIAVGLLFLAMGLWLIDRWSYVMYILRVVGRAGDGR